MVAEFVWWKIVDAVEDLVVPEVLHALDLAPNPGRVADLEDAILDLGLRASPSQGAKAGLNLDLSLALAPSLGTLGKSQSLALLVK
jgi:hypothetical protein